MVCWRGEQQMLQLVVISLFKTKQI